MQPDLAALNKDAIAAAKQHMGAVAWPTALLAVGTVSAFVANLWLFSAGWQPVWSATLIFAVLTYFSYTPLHEAAHGNIHGRHDRLQWLNDACGFMVAPLIAIPYASHKVEHFTHHRHTNQPDKDPDFVVNEMHQGAWAFVVAGLKMLWVQNTFLFRDYWASAPLRERLIYLSEFAVSIGWRVAVVALIPREGILTVVLAGYFLGAFFTLYWFAYRPHLPYRETRRYQNTNSMLMPRWMKPLEWFWLGQNLHSVHHLFPRVPFYRYHALHREIEPVLRAHGTPVIGIFSRQPVAPSSAR